MGKNRKNGKKFRGKVKENGNKDGGAVAASPLPPSSEKKIYASRWFDHASTLFDESSKTNDVTSQILPKPKPQVFALNWNRRCKGGMKLRYTEPINGKVVLTEEDMTPIADTWGFLLVGCFVGRFPGAKAVHHIKDQWGVHCTVNPYSRGWTIFRFKSQADHGHVFNGGPYMSFGRRLLLKELNDDVFIMDDNFFMDMYPIQGMEGTVQGVDMEEQSVDVQTEVVQPAVEHLSAVHSGSLQPVETVGEMQDGTARVTDLEGIEQPAETIIEAANGEQVARIGTVNRTEMEAVGDGTMKQGTELVGKKLAAGTSFEGAIADYVTQAEAVNGGTVGDGILAMIPALMAHKIGEHVAQIGAVNDDTPSTSEEFDDPNVVSFSDFIWEYAT